MNLTTRVDAKRIGLLRYFTGDPCLNGHIAERRVSSGMCCVCAREHSRKYRAAHPEKVANRKRQKRSDAPSAGVEQRRRYYAKNRRELLERRRAYYGSNVEKESARASRYREKNREKLLAKERTYRENNPHVRSALEATRRARKRRAVPPWFGELDALVWLEAADLVRLRRGATGFDWAADHMIPLSARSACGLHVAANCQVIPAVMNGSKGNKLVLTRPGEWINYLHQQF